MKGAEEAVNRRVRVGELTAVRVWWLFRLFFSKAPSLLGWVLLFNSRLTPLLRLFCVCRGSNLHFKRRGVCAICVACAGHAGVAIAFSRCVYTSVNAKKKHVAVLSLSPSAEHARARDRVHAHWEGKGA